MVLETISRTEGEYTMGRLIDADALMEKFAHPPELMYTNVVMDEIRSAPTIDAAPVRHGRWIGCHHHWAWLVCDQCNEKMLVRKSNHGYIQTFPHNFCPNCGAKMRDGD